MHEKKSVYCIFVLRIEQIIGIYSFQDKDAIWFCIFWQSTKKAHTQKLLWLLCFYKNNT